MTAVLSRLRRVVYTRVGGGAGRRTVLVYVRTNITLIIATISENEQQEGVQFALRSIQSFVIREVDSAFLPD